MIFGEAQKVDARFPRVRVERWSHVESIFAGSGTDDIQEQLPEDLIISVRSG